MSQPNEHFAKQGIGTQCRVDESSVHTSEPSSMKDCRKTCLTNDYCVAYDYNTSTQSCNIYQNETLGTKVGTKNSSGYRCFVRAPIEPSVTLVTGNASCINPYNPDEEGTLGYRLSGIGWKQPTAAGTGKSLTACKQMSTYKGCAGTFDVCGIETHCESSGGDVACTQGST